LKQNPPGPLYLIAGEDDLLRDAALAILRTAVLGAGDEFNYELFYGDEAAGSDVVAAASELPVFAERRLVVVKAAEKLPARETESLLEYLAEPNAATTLVFATPKLDGRLKFSQALAKNAVTIDCSPLREGQLTPWARREAARLGVRLDDDAVGLLKELSGGALYAIRRELEKLAAFVPASRSATAADVHLLRGMEPGASVFDLTLAIAAADRARALSILARNLEAGEAPLRILGSLAWQYRRIWKVQDALRGGGREGEAARTLRMDPANVRSFLARFPEARLQSALRLFLETDAQLKGGSSGQPRMILERLLWKLCDLAQPDSPQTPRRPPAPPGRMPGRSVSNVRTVTRGNRTGR
jgi:DNA polymerase-3 subunit delta